MSVNPGGDVANWLQVIEEAATLALSMANSEDDVMAIFKKNKQLFDAVKAQDAVFFKALMAKFTQAKTRFKEAE